jgi:hypothetical protein
VGKCTESGFSQQRVARQSATGWAFPARRNGGRPARQFRTPLPNLPPDSCRMRAKSGQRRNSPCRPANAHQPGIARRFDGPDCYRILSRINARNAGGAAPSRPWGAKFPQFPCRPGPGASVGRSGPHSFRNLAGVYGRNAGAVALSRRFRLDCLQFPPQSQIRISVGRAKPDRDESFRGRYMHSAGGVSRLDHRRISYRSKQCG